MTRNCNDSLHIDVRAGKRSGPGLTGLQGMVGGLVRLVRRAQAGRGEEGAVSDSPGVAGVLVVTQNGRTGEPLTVRPIEWPSAREMAAARLSVAADDAAELAGGFGEDARMYAGSMGSIPRGVDAWGTTWEQLATAQADRAARCARMAWRLAVQASALRDLADLVGEAESELPEGVCPVCVERQGMLTDGGLCGVCWQATR